MKFREQITQAKSHDAGKDGRQEEKGTTEEEMGGWHHRLHGQELEKALGYDDGKGSMLYSMGSQRVGHNSVMERLNNNHKVT